MTFKAYCEERWGKTKQRVWQMIKAIEIRDSLRGKSQQLLTNEGQARALAEAPPETRSKVIQEVAKSGPVTAKHITDAIERLEKTETKIDKVGQPIPKDILADWNRAEEIGTHLRNLVSQVKCAVKNGIEEQDIIFSELHNTDIAPIEGTHYTLSQILPHSVCTACKGHEKKKCRLCLGRGFISKFRFEQCVDSETKKVLNIKK